MKVLGFLASAFVAVAVVGAYSNNGQYSQEILHKLEKNIFDQGQRQWNNVNDEHWYNKGLNLMSDIVNHHSYSHGQGYGQQRQHDNTYTLKHQNYNGDLSSGMSSSEYDINDEYIQGSGLKQNDAAYIVGNTSAKKMLQFYAIVDKYMNNGQIQNRWSNEHVVEVPKVTIPLPNHQFLSMSDNKISGLEPIIKSIKLNTENNDVEVDYKINELSVNGHYKTNEEQNGNYQVKLLNTEVCLSTELYNKNLKTVNAFNEKLDMNVDFGSTWENDKIIKETTKYAYIRNLKRTIENELYENTYHGLIGNMRLEAQKEFSLPAEAITNMEIYNKKTGLKVWLNNGKFIEDLKTNTKVSFVAVRPIKSGNGYRVKVNIILAKQPSWESDITAQKGEQQSVFRKVQFLADEIIAYAVLENLHQHKGGRQFRVTEVSTLMNGLRFNLNNDQTLATELEQNLRQMLENNMAVVLKEQLKQEYQVYQQNPEQYYQYNRSARTLV